MKIKILILAAILAFVGVIFWKHHAAAPVLASAENTAKQTVKKTAAAATAKTDACRSNKAAKAVIVSLGKQHMWACGGSAEAYDTPVTTGATTYGDGTPTGTWAVYSKQTDTHLTGSDSRGSWDDYVNYWMPFYGEYGFHDATWQTFPFGSLTQYQTGGSHGCVHLPLAAMKWLYTWAPVGTTVTIEA